MRVAVIGGSGFIGSRLVDALRARGDDVRVASLRDLDASLRACDGADVAVNLAGAPLARRWTPAYKEELRRSRVDSPRALLGRLATLAVKPRAYVSGSAVGYYGTSETATFTERDGPGDDFLARLCSDWERVAEGARELGMRVVLLRTGLVLGDGGLLKAMLPPFRLGLGGRIGSGRQWMSWIHIDDEVAIVLKLIDGGEGAYNLTAPAPVTNADFSRALARTLRRPAIFPVPIPALTLVLGEGATVASEGQRVLPERMLNEGYAFKYSEINTALKSLLG